MKVDKDIPTYLDILHCEEKMSCIPKFLYTSTQKSESFQIINIKDAIYLRILLLTFEKLCGLCFGDGGYSIVLLKSID